MTTMQKLIAQFAGKPANQVTVIGAFQPHDLVLVHENPTAEVLSNTTTTDAANVAVILLTDGAERAITFTPQFADGQNITLIIASSAAQDIIVKLNETESKTISVEANKPKLLTLSDRFGIPVVDGSDFFL